MIGNTHRRTAAGLLALLLALLPLFAASAEETVTIKERGIVIPAGTRIYAGMDADSAYTEAEEDTFLTVHYGGNRYYRFKNSEGKTVYVLREEIPETVYPEKAPWEECWAEEEVPVYSAPSAEYGKETGRLEAGTAAAVGTVFGDYIRVSGGNAEGYARLADLVPPGGKGEEKYFLRASLSGFTMTVYRADAEGNPTGEPLYEGETCIGKKTTPTPTGTFVFREDGYELWHRFGPRYAPYAIQINMYRWIHGELCDSKDLQNVKEGVAEQFGTASSGGCVRMHTDLAQWIYYHCGPGTVLEIIP